MVDDQQEDIVICVYIIKSTISILFSINRLYIEISFLPIFLLASVLFKVDQIINKTGNMAGYV